MRTRRPIHLVCTFGCDHLDLLPRLLTHYRDQGVESFYLIRHADSVDDPRFDEAAEICRQADVPIFHTHVGTWSENLNHRLTRYAMSEHPQDWYVIVDTDEFHLYDRPLPELIARCEREGYDHVMGCLLDRVAADGGFPAITDESLWDRFPLAGTVSASLMHALPLKAGVARGHVQLLVGQHGAPEGKGLSSSRVCYQIHHFKWTDTVVARLRRRVVEYAAGTWQPYHPSLVTEAERFLAHVEANAGRLDVGDARFRLSAGGRRYGDYDRWPAAIEEAEGWSWTLKQ